MPDMKIGCRIRELRELNKYTREEFAEKVHISPKFLYEIEAGKKRFSVDILADISQALGVSSDYLLFGGNRAEEEAEKARCLLKAMGSAERSKIQSLLQMIDRM